MGIDISAFRGGGDRLVLNRSLAQGPATDLRAVKASVPFTNRSASPATPASRYRLSHL